MSFDCLLRKNTTAAKIPMTKKKRARTHHLVEEEVDSDPPEVEVESADEGEPEVEDDLAATPDEVEVATAFPTALEDATAFDPSISRKSLSSVNPESVLSRVSLEQKARESLTKA